MSDKNTNINKDVLVEENTNKTEVITETNILSIKQLFKSTWQNFAEHYMRYIGASLISMFLPIVIAIILGIPVIYDIAVLKLSVNDLITGTLGKIFIPYAGIALLITIVASILGSLANTIIVTNNGEVKIREALKKAYHALPGYIWVNVLVALIMLASLIPAIAVFALVSNEMFPLMINNQMMILAVLLTIPAIAIVIMLIFAPFAYVVHGARGKTAIRSSYNITKGRFLWVLVRIFVMWACLAIINALTQKIPVIGFVVSVISTPLVLIYISKMYFFAEKAHRENAVTAD